MRFPSLCGDQSHYSFVIMSEDTHHGYKERPCILNLINDYDMQVIPYLKPYSGIYVPT